MTTCSIPTIFDLRRGLAGMATMLLLLAGSPAWAQPSAAQAAYREGEKQYNLGNFIRAIDAFKQAYELDANAAYLYNIGQAYRQLRDCHSATFFFRRFLAVKASDRKRPLKAELRLEVERWLEELRPCVQANPESMPAPLPAVTGPPALPTTPAPTSAVNGIGPTGSGGSHSVDNDRRHSSWHPRRAPVLTASARAGLAVITAGDLDIPVQPSLLITAARPLVVSPRLAVEVGAALGFTPVPYDLTDGTTRTGSFTAILAHAAGRYAWSPKLATSLELGLGGLFFAGLDAGNPFTAGGAASGPLGMFHVRTGLQVDYAVSPRLVLSATPLAVAVSPARSGLRDDISTVIRYEFLIGAGVRM
jgi:hypothetical protein